MKKLSKCLSALLAIMLIIQVVAPGMTSFATLLEIEETKAYLSLVGYSPNELSSFPVDDVLGMLKDSAGNNISIDRNATAVWKYEKDEGDGIERYEEHLIGPNDTVDLYPGEGIKQFQFELIVGQKGQLNSANDRYIVTAFLVDEFEEDLEIEIFTESEDGTRTEAVPTRCISWLFEYSNGDEERIFDLSYSGNVMESLADLGTVWLNVKSELANNPRVTMEIYPVFIFTIGSQYMYITNTAKPLSGKILNQQMQNPGAGHQIQGKKNTDETFELRIYVDGNEYSRKYFCVRYWNWYPAHEGTMYSIENGVRTNVFSSLETNFNSKDHITELNYKLNPNLPANGEYYFDYDLLMQRNYGDGGTTDYDSLVKKIVLGHYDTIEEAEAAGAPDVTDQVLCGGSFKGGKGYLANYGGEGVDFTVFKHYKMSESFELIYDTLADKITVKATENITWKEFTDLPIIGEADPWFRINGAIANGSNMEDSVYVVENGKYINMDTLYGVGYQTLFINDENVDLKTLKPTFWVADDNRVKVFVGAEQTSGVSEQDFSDGGVYYKAEIDGNERMYFVEYVKKHTGGAKLYVNGPKQIGDAASAAVSPTTREVFLDEYFEEKHDILIANIGDQPLTGLKVELIDAQNVKLDEYWTVGGNGNDTLAAFSTTQSTSDYGELNNLAKIRLLPDGESGGEIKGTIKISADNQEDVYIYLSGVAKNPEIITDSIDNAVMYVPYSYVLSSNNMHDWNTVTYELTSGELPEGLELRPSGEIYGVPQTGTVGTYNFIVTCSHSYKDFDPSSVELTLTVEDNTDENVYLFYADTEQQDHFEFEDHLGEEETEGMYNFVIELSEENGESSYSDYTFISVGEMTDFEALWLNGEKLVAGTDYEIANGSTKATLMNQALEKIKDGRNTISAEFNVAAEKSGKGTTKVTAQNFYVKKKGESTDTPSTPNTPSKPNTPNEPDTPSTPSTPSKPVAPKTYKISYNANGGTGAPSSQTKTHDVALTIRTGQPTREGYTFVGWNTAKDGSGIGYASGGRYGRNASATLYAQWKINEYTVSFDPNGGTGVPSAVIKKHNETATVPSGVPQKQFYTFVGWNTASDGKGTAYMPGAAYKENASVVLYAQWKADNLNVNAEMERIYGESRYETAVEISKKTFESADNVVLACGEGYADALVGVPLAYALKAPVLLVEPNEIHDFTLAEIERLGAQNIKILGGEMVISHEVVNALKEKGYSIERLSGATRFDTAIAVAEKLQETSASPSEEVFIAHSQNYPDALSISSVAAINGVPILYVDGDGNVTSGTTEFIKKHEISKATILGGTAAISEDANENLRLSGITEIARIAGKDRYETCVRINERFADTLTGEALCVTTGTNYPDALAGGVFAALNRLPVVLTSESVKSEQVDYISGREPTRIYVFGGPNAVSDDIIEAFGK